MITIEVKEALLKSLITATKNGTVFWEIVAIINGVSRKGYQASWENSMRFVMHEDDRGVCLEIHRVNEQNETELLSIEDNDSDDEIIVLMYRLYNLVLDRHKYSTSEITKFINAVSAKQA